MDKVAHQTAERFLVLNISVDNVEFPPGSIIHLKATVGNAGTEEVLLEHFAGQLFEVVIRDETGTIVYVHSDRGSQRYFMTAQLHLTMKIPLAYSRGAEKGQPLHPGNYTLTVYLTTAAQGRHSGTFDGVKASTTPSIGIMVRP
jgi:hypothetical protein